MSTSVPGHQKVAWLCLAQTAHKSPVRGAGGLMFFGFELKTLFVLVENTGLSFFYEKTNVLPFLLVVQKLS